MTEMRAEIKNRVTLYRSCHIGCMASSLHPVLTANCTVIQAGLILVDEAEHSGMMDLVTLFCCDSSTSRKRMPVIYSRTYVCMYVCTYVGTCMCVYVCFLFIYLFIYLFITACPLHGNITCFA